MAPLDDEKKRLEPLTSEQVRLKVGDLSHEEHERVTGVDDAAICLTEDQLLQLADLVNAKDTQIWLEHQREKDRMRYNALLTAVPAAILIAYFGLWVYSAFTGWNLPKLDGMISTVITSVFSAAATALAGEFIHSHKNKERLKRSKSKTKPTTLS